MPARRPSQPPVQLFPFLAVLMCALGALVLLLLVTTSRIRDQARARAARPPTVASRQLPPPVHSPPPSRERWQPLGAPPAPRLAAMEPRTHSAGPVLAPPAETLRAQWERTVAELQHRAASLRSQVAEREAAENAEGTTATTLADRIARHEAAALERGRRRTAAVRRQQSALARRDEISQELQRMESEIARRQQERDQAASRYSILPYDGRTGTVRRPVYIECTAGGLTFASEGITITPDQLEGFTSARNPLLAGADALLDYWSLKGLHAGDTDFAGPPYVLLIVRPEGTVGYYVARKMLETLGQPFGYELVPEDLSLQWPPTNADAVTACRTAIEAVLADRSQTAPRGGPRPPGSLEPLHVSDGRGGFHLEEVERLRGSGRSVHFGGRTFDRAPSAGTATADASRQAMPRAAENNTVVAPPPAARGATASATASAPTSSSAGGREPGQFPASATQSAAAVSHSPAAVGAAARPDARATAHEAAGTGGTAQPPRPLADADSSAAGSLMPDRLDPQRPLRALRDPGSHIGLERKVIVRVDASNIVVESERPILVAAGTSRETLQQALAERLQDHFEGWGRPPRSFYWLPRIEFHVLPGGHQHLKRLSDLTDEWELESTVDFVLD